MNVGGEDGITDGNRVGPLKVGLCEGWKEGLPEGSLIVGSADGFLVG